MKLKPKHTGEEGANARLIAAAPELLNSCVALVGAMRRYEMDVDDPPTLEHRNLMKSAQAAIAKAGGKCFL